MAITPFAGLDIAPGDLNALIIDTLLKVGAITHRHDGHAALVDPTPDPTVAAVNTGGQIPAATSIHVGYTLLDADAGETILNSSPQVVTTQGGLTDPTDSPAGSTDYTAGTLLADTYFYAVTVSDGLGGETAIGPSLQLTVEPGNANAQNLLTGLAALITASGGTAWRLWRMKGGGVWYFLNEGTTDAFTDDGSIPGDCSITPPTSANGTTNASNSLSVTVPSAGQDANAVQFRVYASEDGSFESPCLMGTYPIADFDTAIIYTALDVSDGQPPPISRSLPGANKIPAADIIGGGGGGGGVIKGTVADLTALNALTGQVDGDSYFVFSLRVVYSWVDADSQWEPWGAPDVNENIAAAGGAAYALGTGWAQVSPTGSHPLSYVERDAIWAMYEGWVTKTTGAPAAGDVIIAHGGFPPWEVRSFVCTAKDDAPTLGYAVVEVLTDGTVVYQGGTALAGANPRICLDPLRYRMI